MAKGRTYHRDGKGRFTSSGGYNRKKGYPTADAMRIAYESTAGYKSAKARQAKRAAKNVVRSQGSYKRANGGRISVANAAYAFSR